MCVTNCKRCDARVKNPCGTLKARIDSNLKKDDRASKRISKMAKTYDSSALEESNKNSV